MVWACLGLCLCLHSYCWLLMGAAAPFRRLKIVTDLGTAWLSLPNVASRRPSLESQHERSLIGPAHARTDCRVVFTNCRLPMLYTHFDHLGEIQKPHMLMFSRGSLYFVNCKQYVRTYVPSRHGRDTLAIATNHDPTFTRHHFHWWTSRHAPQRCSA